MYGLTTAVAGASEQGRHVDSFNRVQPQRLHVQRLGRGVHLIPPERVVRIGRQTYLREALRVRENLLDDLELLADEVAGAVHSARDISAWTCVVGHQADGHRILYPE